MVAGVLRAPRRWFSASVVALVLAVAAPAGAVQVSAGGGHSCAIGLDAALVCWGLNDDGQATPPAGSFTAVSAGSRHTCAIRTDSTIACWGRNTDGEAAPPAGTFRTVSAGGAHTCAIRTDGTVVCWGQNAGSLSYLPPSGAFARAHEGDSTGSPFACGIRTDASLACWGYNAYGRASPPVGAFTTVDAGGAHSCGIRDSGAIACWGLATYGQPLADPPAGSFTELSSGYNSTCAIRADASITCWGDTPNGETGAPPGSYTELSLGSFHGCAVRDDGAVSCWGANTTGQVSPIPAELTTAIGETGPGGLDFGSQPAGTVSAPQEVTVTNRGARSLHVEGTSFAGPGAADFLIGASTCGGPVAGGASCRLSVRFTPAAGAATGRSATLLITTDAVPAAYTVALSGLAATPVPVTGPAGPPGPQGGAGPAGAQGPAGKASIATCKVTKVPKKLRRKLRVRCTVTLAKARTVSLLRGRQVVARRHVKAGRHRLVFRVAVGGRYRLY